MHHFLWLNIYHIHNRKTQIKKRLYWNILIWIVKRNTPNSLGTKGNKADWVWPTVLTFFPARKARERKCKQKTKTTTFSAGLTLASHQWCPFYNEVLNQPLGQMSGYLRKGHNAAAVVRNFLREIKHTIKKRVGFSIKWHYFHSINRFLKYVWCLSQRQTGNILRFYKGQVFVMHVSPPSGSLTWEWMHFQVHLINRNTESTGTLAQKSRLGDYKIQTQECKHTTFIPKNPKGQERSPGNNT